MFDDISENNWFVFMKTVIVNIKLANEIKTLQLGSNISLLCKSSVVIYLYGELGSGKTTFSRGFLNGLGYTGIVKSPTYSLVESYYLSSIVVNHFDLYRLIKEKDLEFIGINDFFSNQSLSLIEWPQKGLNLLPSPDVIVHLKYQKNSGARLAKVSFVSTKGLNILKYFNF